MDTILIGSGIISPRYYQVPGDKIEAKQAMEPLAIASGIGPMVGFNVVSTSESNVRITGINNPELDLNTLKKVRKNSETKVTKLTVNGQEGKVVNAHITSSGLLSIDPLWIDTGIPSSQVSTGHSLIVVKARLDFISEIENNLENIPPPSNNNFISKRVTNWVHNGVNINASVLAGYSYKELEAALQSASIVIDYTKEVLIGIYEFNPSETLITDNPEFYSIQDNIIPLVPYYYIWPPMVGNDIKTYALTQYLKGKVEWILDNLTPEVKTENIVDSAVTSPKLAAKAVTTEKLDDGAVTTVKIANSAITSNKLGSKAVTTEKIGDQAVTAAQIKTGVIGTNLISDKAVTTGKIADEAITASKIADKTITAAQLADEAVGSGKIGSGAITPDKLAGITQLYATHQDALGGGVLYIQNEVQDYYPGITVEVKTGANSTKHFCMSSNTIPLTGATSIRFLKTSTVINNIKPSVKLYKYQTPWSLFGTYTFKSSGAPFGTLATDVIPVNDLNGIGFTIKAVIS